MPRADDPLAVFIFLLARNAVPFGAIEKCMERALSDVVPELPEGDPLADWARAEAGKLRRES